MKNKENAEGANNNNNNKDASFDPNFTFYKPFAPKDSIDPQDLYEMNLQIKTTRRKNNHMS